MIIGIRKLENYKDTRLPVLWSLMVNGVSIICTVSEERAREYFRDAVRMDTKQELQGVGATIQ